jgi:hypothetical protein
MGNIKTKGATMIVATIKALGIILIVLVVCYLSTWRYERPDNDFLTPDLWERKRLIGMGHTEQCDNKMVWGDGECECKGGNDEL